MRKTVATCKKPQQKGRKTPSRTSYSPPPTERLSAPLVPWMTDKVVILDLDHTLVDSTGHKGAEADRLYVLRFGPDTIKGSVRPYAKEFIEFLWKYTPYVIVYTAARREYAEQIVDLLFGDKRPIALWSREHCGIRQDAAGNDYYVKPILDLVGSMGLDPEAALIIDDNAYVYRDAGAPDSGVLIPGYYGSNDDKALVDAMKWFVSPPVMHSWSMHQVPKSSVFSN